LEPHGIVFEGEANACFDEANSRLIVKADRREIESIAKVLESFAREKPR
jgi:retron-type reverse transcriptase